MEQIELQSIGQDDDPVLATTDNEPYAEFSEFGEFDGANNMSFSLP